MGRLEAELTHDINVLSKYIETQTKSGNNDTSVHYYETDANKFIRSAIQRIRCSTSIYDSIMERWGQGMCVSHAIEMNEMYSSRLRGAGGDAGSDAVFQVNHIDGPFWFVPDLTMVRLIVTLYNETNIKTNLKGRVVQCGAGEFLAHDYNRDPHFIFGEQTSDQLRYVLKFHYVLYPDWMPAILVDAYKGSNVIWNSAARRLFVFTLNPTTPIQSFASWGLNLVTILVGITVGLFRRR